MKKIMMLGIAFSITGCVTLDPLPLYEASESTEVTIFRSGELQGSFSEVYVGWQEKYFFSLAPNEYTRVTVANGFTTFNVKADADKRSDLTIDVRQGRPICLMLEVNPENIVAVNWYVPGYSLRQIPCLSDSDKAQYQFAPQQMDIQK